MGATDAFIIPPDGSLDGKTKGNHCSHTCSIVILCTIVPFCILSILFLIVYASCGHRYLSRRRKQKQQQKALKELELRKLGDGDTIMSRDTGYPRGEDALALGWGPVRDLEAGVEAAPTPPPISRDRHREDKGAVGSRF